MLGLGETKNEVEEVMQDLHSANCDIITLGQYLQPSENLVPVEEYIHPEQFQEYKRTASPYGFKAVISGPLVRSSYNAEEIFSRI